MRLNKPIFAAVASGAYAILFIATFDVLDDSVLITSVALTGVFGWLYGPRIGLLSVILILLLNTALLFLVSGKSEDILLTYNLTGISFSAIAALTTGFMRASQRKIELLQTSLSDRVDEATGELDRLTQYIIEKDEEERISMGQDLHDGVGQYLTGMLLHCEALSLDLAKTHRTETALAERMTQRIKNSLIVIRRLSRSQLPLRTAETTLAAALEELTTYFDEASSANSRLTHEGDCSNLPPITAKHLYRIVYEAVHRFIYKYRAKNIDIRLITRTHNYVINIEATNFTQNIPDSSELISKVMEYRARTIGGKFVLTPSPEGGFLLECSTISGEKNE